MTRRRVRLIVDIFLSIVIAAAAVGTANALVWMIGMVVR
jgi:hypothetical protein